ncbi:MAG: hypothetical protein AAF251_03465 [Pseudomonadota bacterium]
MKSRKDGPALTPLAVMRALGYARASPEPGGLGAMRDLPRALADRPSPAQHQFLESLAK